MKRWLFFCLLIATLLFVLSNFRGLSNQGTYESIVLDFRDDIPAQIVQTEVNAIAQQYKAQLNSQFSRTEQVYVLQGNAQLLTKLRNSELANYTETIEPNYI
jgi:serine protease